jgi:hypothetical protein
VLFGEWSEEWGRQATQAVLRSDPATDAIFCGGDQMARGAAGALREAARRVPADVALVGYDNWDVFAEAGRPPLTTVDMQLKELGMRAASGYWPRSTATVSAGLSATHAAWSSASPPASPSLPSSQASPSSRVCLAQ